MYFRKISSLNSNPNVNIPLKNYKRKVLIIDENSKINVNIITDYFDIKKPVKTVTSGVINLPKEFINKWLTIIPIRSIKDIKIIEEKNNIFRLEVKPIEIFTKKVGFSGDVGKLTISKKYVGYNVLILESEFQR